MQHENNPAEAVQQAPAADPDIKQVCKRLVALHEQLAAMRVALKQQCQTQTETMKAHKQTYGELLQVVGDYMQEHDVPVFQNESFRISLGQRKAVAPLTAELLAEATAEFIKAHGVVTNENTLEFLEFLRAHRTTVEPRVTVRGVRARKAAAAASASATARLR